MNALEIILLIIYILALIGAFVMLFYFYVCDNHTCKIYMETKEQFEPGTKEYIMELLNRYGSDGIWGIPFVIATIATGLILVMTKMEINMTNFFIIFFTIFLATYFGFSFTIHHYLDFIVNDTIEYINV